ncbi:MAG: hypothetical protein EBX52_14460 [Proteobacteria bacterium]|nr:hypothetical protein [Pseudomonadota bacterium]
MIASASGTFASQGDAQLVQFVLRNNSTGATPVNLKLDGSTTNLTIPNGKMMTCLIQITGINSTGADTLNYFKQVSIKNVAGTTTLIHQNVVGGNYRTNPAMDAVVSADNANSCLQIQCTGLAGQTTRWVAVVMGTELAYA